MDSERILSPPNKAQLVMLDALTQAGERLSLRLAQIPDHQAVTLHVGDPNGQGGQVITAAHGAQPLVQKIIA